MEKFRVLLTDGLEQPGKDILSAENELSDLKGISAEDLMNELPAFDAVIVRGRTKMNRQAIASSQRLKVIGRCGVGVDNIDLDAAKEHGVTVVNAPVATTTSVAELTMGLIYSLAREIPRANAGMKNGEWLKKSLVGMELNGKTLGVIGYGRIGATVGKLAASTGMRINAFDPGLTQQSTFVDGGDITPYEQVLKESDFISIHTPLNGETKHMIDSEAIDMMKDGVRIVCAARGGIIDEKALLAGLNSGKIAGVALDVFETEPPIDSDLIGHPHLIATPHIGGQTEDAQLRASQDIASEVLAALRGEGLRWKIV
jgi:D-3-phosphoglycerate dehydrogenase / 2-oxoglutarate reductase